MDLNEHWPDPLWGNIPQYAINFNLFLIGYHNFNNDKYENTAFIRIEEDRVQRSCSNTQDSQQFQIEWN